jgi:diguanylate cyclase (GGDEF)-like protein/PAS domain S-box-containing protein
MARQPGDAATVGEAATAARMPQDEIDRRLASALTAAGAVVVTGVQVDGLLVRAPSELLVSGRRDLTGYSSILELVEPACVEQVSDLWAEARSSGVGEAVVRLKAWPETNVTVGCFDLTERYGVYVGVLSHPAALHIPPGTTVTDSVPRVAVVLKDENAIITEVDEATTAILGWSREQLIGRRSLDFIDAPDHEAAIGAWLAMIADPTSQRRVRLRHRHSDGSVVWFDVTNRNRLHDADFPHVYCEMVDVTVEVEAQQALHEHHQLLRQIAEALPVGVIRFDVDGTVRYCNGRAVELLGDADVTSVEVLVESVEPQHRAPVLEAYEAANAGQSDQTLEVVITREGAMTTFASVTFRGLVDGHGEPAGVIASLSDVTESVRLRQSLARRANFDVLTGCKSRGAVLDTLADAAASGSGVAAVFIDLDRFKEINDQFGHEAGDALLRAASERLLSAVRRGDEVGRLGGDEFLVVCPGVSSGAVPEHIGRRVSDALQGDVAISAHVLPLRASVGVSWTATPAPDVDALVARADQAMYLSKQTGSGRPVISEFIAPRIPEQHTRQPRLAPTAHRS